MALISYRRHRFPPEIIQHAIWLYLRFTLSYRDVEELLAERGLDLSYETPRRWVLKFGPTIARQLRRRRPRPSDRWHLDEMVVRIAGKRMYLWLPLIARARCSTSWSSADKRAALRLMRKLLKKQRFVPKLLVTDKLRLYALAFRPLGLSCPRAQNEQSSGKFASGGAPTRAQIATLQVGSIHPALSQRPRCGPQHLQPSTPSRLPIDTADIQSRGDGALVRRRRGSVRPDQPVDVTKPFFCNACELPHTRGAR
jgi:transposase-like protein